MTTGDLHTKFREDWSNGSRDMLTDRQTHKHTDAQTHRQTHRQTDHNTPLHYRGGVKKTTNV